MLSDRCLSVLSVMSVCLSVCLSWTLVYCGQMDQDTTWYEVGLGPCDIVLDGDPAPPTERGTAACSPLFSPCLAVVAKRLPVSATAQLLSKFVQWQTHQLSFNGRFQVNFPPTACSGRRRRDCLEITKQHTATATLRWKVTVTGAATHELE